jgi:aminopeptidase N
MMSPSSRTLVFAAGLMCAAGISSAQPSDIHGESCERFGCGKASAMAMRFLAGGLPGDESGGFSGREAFGDTDVLHNNAEVELFFGTQSVAGFNEMTLRSTRDGLSEFTFMLRSNFTVSELRVNGAVVPLATMTSVGSYGRRIALPRAFARDEVFTVRVAYSGATVSRGFGSATWSSAGGQPAFATLSEPYFAATWLPVKDTDFAELGDNSDKSTWDLAVIAPSNMVTASNGVLAGIDDLSGGRRRYRWSTDYQTSTYLVCIGTHPYNRWTQTWNYTREDNTPGTMPVEFFIYPSSDNAANRAAWGGVVQMLTTLSGVYGTYPFANEKYGIYQFAFGGGMEHQTMSGQGTFSESVTVHELGHQWWGDNVTCRTWSDLWLNEGFATYSEALWYERRPGASPTGLRDSMNARRPRDPSVVVYRSDVSNVNSLFAYDAVYAKGAWVVHMLRRNVGDATFFDILREYRAAYQGSGATTDNFIDLASAVAGRDLRPFIEAFVYQPGVPSFAYSSQTANINGRPYLKLRLRQTQGAAALNVYPMPIDVRYTSTLGTGTFVVQSDARTVTRVIPLGSLSLGGSVLIDPEDWTLNGGETSEAFAAIPPVVVEAQPGPGASFDGAGPAAATITFSENVTGATYQVLRNGSPVSFSASYNSAAQTATLNFGSQLASGSYTVRVSGATSVGAGLALDGDVGASLPSGNGQAGGDAVISFTVTRCPADFNADGFVDFFDFDDFVTAFESGGAGADFNNDGFVDFFDFDDFVVAFEVGC